MFELVVDGRIVPEGIGARVPAPLLLLLLLVTGAAVVRGVVTGSVLGVAGPLAELEPVTLVPTAGAGLAREGSTNAPTPHGMAEPSGSVGLAAATDLPLASAIVKRVVQVKLREFGEVNW